MFELLKELAGFAGAARRPSKKAQRTFPANTDQPIPERFVHCHPCIFTITATLIVPFQLLGICRSGKLQKMVLPGWVPDDLSNGSQQGAVNSHGPGCFSSA